MLHVTLNWLIVVYDIKKLRTPLPGGSSLCEGMGEGCCTQPYLCICKEAVSGFEPMTNKSPRHNFTAAPGLALIIVYDITNKKRHDVLNAKNHSKLISSWKFLDFNRGRCELFFEQWTKYFSLKGRSTLGLCNSEDVILLLTLLLSMDGSKAKMINNQRGRLELFIRQWKFRVSCIHRKRKL